MFSVERSVPVNAGLAPGEPVLTRHHIWLGLVLKAEDAVPFVPAMSWCKVTGRFENGLFRDIVFRGEAMTEKILFHPEEKVEFIRTAGIEMGTIVNEILEDETGELSLRFAFTLEREDLPHGSAEEREFADGMAKGYLVAVQATVDEIRKRVKGGVIAAA
ncbi:MAG: SRPBCC family protein [Defluviicoccus sp.]|nr:SRPBCC family protein [Defluviicoccus sp.]MDE0386139.1 SRPBCC family protein [Defluviicoccus sp.]